MEKFYQAVWHYHTIKTEKYDGTPMLLVKGSTYLIGVSGFYNINIYDMNGQFLLKDACVNPKDLWTIEKQI